MRVRDIQDEIIRLKKENDVCILAHLYQNHEILEVADFVGDSFGLSQQAAKAPQKNVVMCGVRFMAETVKILSPEKKVILSAENAGCPMAEQLTVEELRELKKKYPDHAVVAYINTTSALKTECDVCVTSASAEKIVKKIDSENILFIPDCNLGEYISKQIPEKKFTFIKGGCPIHLKIKEKDVLEAKKAHPEAALLVHPECHPTVTAYADYAGSTTGIMDFAKKSDKKEFIIGTENSIVEHLQYECPDKKFYPLFSGCICNDMKLTTLPDVLACVKGVGGAEIELDESTMRGAKRCIDEMLRLG